MIKIKCPPIQYFSLTFNKSADVIDTAQLLVFIRAVAKDVSIHKDFVKFIFLSDTTRAVDIKKNCAKCASQSNTKFITVQIIRLIAQFL